MKLKTISMDAGFRCKYCGELITRDEVEVVKARTYRPKRTKYCSKMCAVRHRAEKKARADGHGNQ